MSSILWGRTYHSRKGKLQEQKVCGSLVASYFTQRDGARLVPMRRSPGDRVARCSSHSLSIAVDRTPVEESYNLHLASGHKAQTYAVRSLSSDLALVLVWPSWASQYLQRPGLSLGACLWSLVEP